MGRKLLVADDSVTIQKVIKLALSSEGYDILTVSEGKEAIRAIQEERPDVVLIDVTLPGADAFAVKRAANADPKLAATGFILMLSAFERVDEEAIESVKFQGRLIKPFDPSHLRKAVADVLAGKGAAKVSSEPPLPPPPQVPDFEQKKTPDGDDLPPVHGMHPTVPDEPGETVTEEEFLEESPVEVTRLSLEPAKLEPTKVPDADREPKIFSMPNPASATFDLESMSPSPGSPPAGAPPPPPAQPPEEKTDPNFTLPDEAVTRSLESDIKNLTESTIKMSGLDEWSLDDSKKMKSPPDEIKPPEAPVRVVAPPPKGPNPASERTKETTIPSIDKRAAVLRGLMTPPTHQIDDGGSTFSLSGPPKTSPIIRKEPELSAPRSSTPSIPPASPITISNEVGLGREYVGPSAPPPAAEHVIPPPAQHERRAEPMFAPPKISAPAPGPESSSSPITRAEIEQLIRKDFESAIEKLARETFPKIAEQIIRQEIEKILAEP